jgi:hypothetical protein
VLYLSQQKAWSDSKTFKQWFTQGFLPHLRGVDSQKALLIMDNCSSHEDLEDPSGRVKIATLPPNCTSKHQPMDQGVIAAFKTRYRSKLLMMRASTMYTAAQLREQAKARRMTKGTMGLAEGHDPHILDACELALDAWKDVERESVVRCWLKAEILPPQMHADLSNEHGRGVRHGAKDASVEQLTVVLHSCSLAWASSRNHESSSRSATAEAADAEALEVAEALQSLGITPGRPPSQISIQAALQWTQLEEEEDISTALRNDAVHELMHMLPQEAAAEEADGASEEEPQVEEQQPQGGNDAAGRLPPPPPFKDLIQFFEPLQQVADDCCIEEATILLRKLKLAFISAHGQRPCRQTVIGDFFEPEGH